MTERYDEFGWLREFDGSERDEVDGWAGLSAAERAEIERLDAEVFGALVEGLDPVEPSAGLRQRVLDAAAPADVVPFAASQRPATTTAASRWPLQLAAALALAAFGVAWWFSGTVRDQRGQLAELELKVEALGVESAALASLREDLAAARENLQLVGGKGVEVCPLRPQTASAAASTGQAIELEGAHGLLFVAEDHQHWYLRTGGLEPRDGEWYRVWFIVSDGSAVPAGNLLAGELDLGSPTMPEDTRAVLVTLESEPEPEEPSERQVLYGVGEEMIRLI